MVSLLGLAGLGLPDYLLETLTGVVGQIQQQPITLDFCHVGDKAFDGVPLYPHLIYVGLDFSLVVIHTSPLSKGPGPMIAPARGSAVSPPRLASP